MNITTILVADQHPIFRMGLRAALDRVADLHVLPDLASPGDLRLRIDSALPDIVIIDAGIALQPDVLPSLLATIHRGERPRFILVLDDPAAQETTTDPFWDALVPRRASVETLVAVVREVAARPPRSRGGWPTYRRDGVAMPIASGAGLRGRPRPWRPSDN